MTHYRCIKKWATERGIYQIPFNNLAQLGFLAEEKHEFLTAKDDNERIDALCDLVVFATNAIYTLDRNYNIYDEWSIKGYGLDSSDLLIINSQLSNHEQNISYEMKFNNSLKVSWRYELLIRDCKRAINLLGYNYDKAMNETLKEIESRVGYFDESRGKWIKTETKYKANYELASIKNKDDL